MARVTKSKGQYNSTGEQYRVCVHGLPADAPASHISTTWHINAEPDIDNLWPSKVIELISEQVESYWISTSRQRNKEIINWCRTNPGKIDRPWVEREIKKLEKLIEKKTKAVARFKEAIEKMKARESEQAKQEI